MDAGSIGLVIFLVSEVFVTLVPFWKPRHFNGSGGKKDSRKSSLLITTTTLLVAVPIALMDHVTHVTKTSINPLDFARLRES
ncbi:hypothetical protein KTT_47690 [Tengunoibacter tsumagoiensis]|uniref:Uncharacterized protein n=1 Tax=Tengunoibacter tsumagoiensis TaxID=2014871 RepID=A0A402A6Y9_9CHLR|nr:hypothetical protein KTT_47690 [Tengunoibacter tsumagoiensis]